MVWEDEAVVEPAAAAGAKHIESQPSAAEDASGSTALRERQANGNAGGEAAGSQPTKKPSSPKKSGKAAGKPSGKAAGKTSGKVRCFAWSAAHVGDAYSEMQSSDTRVLTSTTFSCRARQIQTSEASWRFSILNNCVSARHLRPTLLQTL